MPRLDKDVVEDWINDRIPCLGDSENWIPRNQDEVVLLCEALDHNELTPQKGAELLDILFATVMGNITEVNGTQELEILCVETLQQMHVRKERIKDLEPYAAVLIRDWARLADWIYPKIALNPKDIWVSQEIYLALFDVIAYAYPHLSEFPSDEDWEQLLEYYGDVIENYRNGRPDDILLWTIKFVPDLHLSETAERALCEAVKPWIERYHEAPIRSAEREAYRIWKLMQLDSSEPRLGSSEFEAFEEEVERQVNANPDDTSQIIYLASVKMKQWDWPTAESYFLRALDVEASREWQLPFHLAYSGLLAVQGRIHEALHQIDTGIEKDPVNHLFKAYRVVYRAMQLLGLERNMPALIQEMNDAILQIDPEECPGCHHAAYLYLAHGLTKNEQYGPAREALREIDDVTFEAAFCNRIESFEDVFLSGMYLSRQLISGSIAARTGELDKAQDVIDKILDLGPHKPGVPQILASLHLELDEPEAALDWIEVGVSRRDANTALVTWDRTFAPLKDHQRFLKAADEMNLEVQL